MRLNINQKITILIGIIFLSISFLIPPCYVIFGGQNVPVGYIPLALFKVEAGNKIANRIFLHTPTFYAQIITISVVIIGLVILFDNKNKL